MEAIKVREKQNIFDIIAQETGTIQTLFNVLADNDINVNTIEQTIPDELIEIGTYDDSRRSAVNRIKEPVISGVEEDTELEGIGYWQIEKDFIIS